MELWAHQKRAITEVLAAIGEGKRRICLTMPTGLGKTATARVLIEGYLAEGRKASFYSNRKLLVEQTSGVMERAGVEHGVRMSGSKEELDRLFQISSVQTEAQRVLKRKSRSIHSSELVIIDELHLNASKMAGELVKRHLEHPGCVMVGLTATPIDLAHFCDHLIVAGTVSEGRACGALVPAHHFGPDEPDLRHIGRVALGDDLSEEQVRSAMGRVTDGRPDPKITHLFGRVFEWYARLNPEQKPTLLFAPGVAESVWFAEQFAERGITSAHIDGEDVWVDGELVSTSPEVRRQVIAAFREGRIKVLCNRFVLREGLDIPEVEHLILATVIGSLQGYIQIGGRGLRASPATGKTHCVVQDHGGMWWKQGSLNADREWELDCTSGGLAAIREEKLRAKEEREPFLCPQCARVLNNVVCPSCGFTVDLRKKSRPVIDCDGRLREYRGDIYPPRRTRSEPDTAEKWKRMYYRMRKAGKSFRQAEALFWYEEGYYPPRTLPLMPRTAQGWIRKIDSVAYDELH